MSQIIVGGDGGTELVGSLREEGFAIDRVPAPVTARALEDSGIGEAAMFVLTDVDEATSIPIARELNAGLDVIVLSRTSLPEFASPIADLVVHPDAIDPSMLVEELARRARSTD